MPEIQEENEKNQRKPEAISGEKEVRRHGKRAEKIINGKRRGKMIYLIWPSRTEEGHSGRNENYPTIETPSRANCQGLAEPFPPSGSKTAKGRSVITLYHIVQGTKDSDHVDCSPRGEGGSFARERIQITLFYEMRKGIKKP